MRTVVQRSRRSLVYFGVHLLMFLFNIMPRRTAVFVGAMFGLAAWQILPKDRHKIDRHLSLVYGETLTARERALIGRGFFVNSGKNIVDILRFKKHFAREVLPLVETEGMEIFDRAYKAGRGIIGVTGHIGNFELLAAYIVSQGYQSAVIGRELYDPRLNALLIANRTAMGITNIATTDSPKKLLRWLKDGKVVGILIDTDSFRVRSLATPFFGRLSNTPVGQTILGLKTGAALIPVACVRIPGDRYKVIVKPAIQVETSIDLEQAVYEVTLLCNKALEEIVDSYRDQWIWLHNRWRTPAQNPA